GHQVQKLQRVAFAGLTFHGLRVGDARELTQEEVNELREQVGLDRRSVSRGVWKAKREDTDRARREHEQKRAEREAQGALLTSSVKAPAVREVRREPDADEMSERDFERQLAAAGAKAKAGRERGRGMERERGMGKRRSGTGTGTGTGAGAGAGAGKRSGARKKTGGKPQRPPARGNARRG